MAGDPLFGRGTLRMWDDEKGFGFIDPIEGGADVFLHISALGGGSVRPEVGALITYRRTLDEQQRPRAIKARMEVKLARLSPTFSPLPDRRVEVIPPRRSLPRSRVVSPSRWSEPRVQAGLGVAVFLAALTGAAALGFLNAWVPALYAVMSSVTFTAYHMDKSCAENGERRVSEKALHILEALGGWPGALIAQQWLRHKTSKVRYQVIFWLIVAAHLALWIGLAVTKSGAA